MSHSKFLALSAVLSAVALTVFPFLSSAQQAVDLGLSVQWASFNVGADGATDPGAYFAWGETQPKSDYSMATYKWAQGGGMTKYRTHGGYGKVDNLTVLEPQDDAATKNWGAEWRTPTISEWEELSSKCRWEWTAEKTPSGETVWGYWVISPMTGNRIFLPAGQTISGAGEKILPGHGLYWSSSLSESDDSAHSWGFDGKKGSRWLSVRTGGNCVRAVTGGPVLPSGSLVVPVESLKLDRTAVSIKAWEAVTLVVTITPETPTDSQVFWSSSDVSVATVDQTGRVIGSQEGKTTVTVECGGRKASCIVTVTDRHESVDMGVSVRWSACNLGAWSRSASGYFIAWGELGEKQTYTEANYKFRENRKYNKPGYIMTLERADDAASNEWGGKWRIPTRTEWDELIENCNMSWTMEDGVPGMLLTSKINGNTLFFPASGYKSGSSKVKVGEWGCYWMSNTKGWQPYEPNAIVVYRAGCGDLGEHGSYVGYMIRPVKD